MSRQLRGKQVSVKELVTASLDAAEKLNGAIKAFELIDHNSALASAKQADEDIQSGRALGPLHGIPVAIKDIIHVNGWPTRCGSSIYTDRPAKEDAYVVHRLRQSGAILIGKTVPHEFACGVYSEPARNPWNVDCVPGGSSGGSAAAVSAGIVPMALGSDTGGSIRIPASVCGITGLKPTFNRVSCVGVEPLSWSLDHIGPLAASVEDCAISLSAMSDSSALSGGDSVNGFTSYFDRGVEGLRMGVLYGAPINPMHANVETTFFDAVATLEGIGAKRIDITIPELKHTIAAEFAIVGAEAGHYHRERIKDHSDAIDSGIKSLLIAGLLLPTEHYLRGLQARKIITARIKNCFDLHQLDILVTPTLPTTAAAYGQTDFEFEHLVEPVTISYVRSTAPFNLSGLPALSVPCGLDDAGLPIGLQLVGRPLDEATVLGAGHAFESATVWHKKRPSQFDLSISSFWPR